MTKDEFISWVRVVVDCGPAAWPSYHIEFVRTHDRHMALLMEQENASSAQLFEYCKRKAER